MFKSIVRHLISIPGRIFALAILLFFIQPVFCADSSHVIIVIMDGARYTETWGDPSHAHIPMIAKLAVHGTVLSNFRTAAIGSIAERFSETCPGHARITTGTYQNIPNDGKELPSQPGLFQQFLKISKKPSSACWLITSKDKLFILGNSSSSDWMDKYPPSMRCGQNGDGTGGYCDDSITHSFVLEKLTNDHPSIMLVNYKDPDSMGHANNWEGYLAAIDQVDGYVNEIWQAVQSDAVLKETTTLFIVNDHGRHTTDFTSHGDACEGCTHVMFIALGSGIRTNYGNGITHEQIDLAPTVAMLLKFPMPTVQGHVMKDILAEK